MTLKENILFWVGTGTFTAVMSFIIGKICIKLKRQTALEDGIKAILRDRILHAYNHYSEKGYAPFYAMENVTNMYTAYHNLGGNGAVTEIYHKFMKLPQQQ